MKFAKKTTIFHFKRYFPRSFVLRKKNDNGFRLPLRLVVESLIKNYMRMYERRCIYRVMRQEIVLMIVEVKFCKIFVTLMSHDKRPNIDPCNTLNLVKIIRKRRKTQRHQTMSSIFGQLFIYLFRWHWKRSQILINL